MLTHINAEKQKLLIRRPGNSTIAQLLNIGVLILFMICIPKVSFGEDTDDDGLRDSWERKHFSSIEDCIPTDDPDGDGLSNQQEYQANSDPTFYALSLDPGWNLVSLARLPENRTFGNVLGDYVGSSMWEWKKGKYMKCEQDTQLQPLKGYWIYNSRAEKIIIPITPPNSNSGANQLKFTDVNGVPVDTIVKSNYATISGAEGSVFISISNGEYRIGDGNWTTSDNTVQEGDAIQLRLRSNLDYNTSVTATVTVDQSEESFTVTTEERDTSPDPFDISNKVDVPLNRFTDSEKFEITGINAPTEISITNGEYIINKSGLNPSWETESSTVNNHDEVQVRVKSADAYGVSTSATLYIGDKSATFEVTTKTFAP